MRNLWKIVAGLVLAALIGLLIAPGALAQAPTVEILDPREGDTIGSSTITLRFRLTDWTLVPPMGQPNAAGEGHVHLFVDGSLILHFSGTERMFTLSPGSHSIKVEVVNNDHTPLNPPVADEVAFETTLTTEGRLLLEKVDGLTNLVWGTFVVAIVAVAVGIAALARGRRAQP